MVKNQTVISKNNSKSKETSKLAAPLPPLFGKENFMLMAIGGIIIAVGMVLMSGGKNADPNVFDYNVVYSPIRITVAPILIILGLVIEIFAILRKQTIKVAE